MEQMERMSKSEEKKDKEKRKMKYKKIEESGELILKIFQFSNDKK